MVHLKVFTPTPNPVTPEVGEAGVVIVAGPAITVHKPVPTVGEFAASVELVAQTAWSTPAAEIVGKSVLVIVISSIEDAQTPFEIVQRNVFAPTLNPVTPDVGEVGVVMVAPPEMTVHKPVPIVGVFPASVPVVAQRF